MNTTCIPTYVTNKCKNPVEIISEKLQALHLINLNTNYCQDNDIRYDVETTRLNPGDPLDSAIEIIFSLAPDFIPQSLTCSIINDVVTIIAKSDSLEIAIVECDISEIDQYININLFNEFFSTLVNHKS